MSAPDERTGYVYLTVYPGRSWYELRVAKATNKKPRTTPEGSVVVKIKLRMPKAAFEPLTPEAEVIVPAELVQHPITVTAEDAS